MSKFDLILVLKLALNKPVMALTGSTTSTINQISPGSVVAVGLALLLLYIILDVQSSLTRSLPLINGRKLLEFSNANVIERYRTNTKELLELGFKKVCCYSGEIQFSIMPNKTTTDRR
jgi:hypothetical protein